MIDALPLLLAPEGYQISRSVRLRSSASAYFSRTPASATNRTTYTWSGWVKRGLNSGGNYEIFSAGTSSPNYDALRFAGDVIQFYTQGASAGNANITTTALYRDYSAWYHIVVAVDSTQATASNRIKLYVNGSQITSLGTATYMNQNNTGAINSAIAHHHGAVNVSGLTNYFDGYITEVNFIDGQALTASSFGETDVITGVWKPKKYTGSYGTNGFYLNFSDNSAATAAAIGKDYSGNGNNWTPNNISLTAGTTYDSMIDVPTPWSDGGNGRGNYAVLNPLSSNASMTIAGGNLNVTSSVASQGFNAYSTIAVATGQYYVEATVNTGVDADMIGVCPSTFLASTGRFDGLAGGVGYYRDGRKFIAGVATAYGASYTTGDVIGIALDMDAQTVAFYKNGVSQGTISSSLTANVPYYFVTGDASAGTGINQSWNFGQRPFSSTPPTGFKALNTQNLPEPLISNGRKWFDVSLWSGTGANQNIVNSGGFQPDLVWNKSRSNIASNVLTDAVRGVNLQLFSDSTSAEQNIAGQVTAFNSNGFTVGADANGGTNFSGRTYAGWQWKKGATPGFDIVTYTGTAGAQNISHSLGVAPAMIITKVRNNPGGNWAVYHKSMGNTGGMWMNLTNAFTTQSLLWNNTSPTSSVFSVGSNNTDTNWNTYNFVAYLFSEVAGFSKFGSYTGNGSADGVFVYTGMMPRFILIKRTDAAGSWYIHDTARGTYNVLTPVLYADLSNAEGNYAAGTGFDVLSNGFKARTTNTEVNASGGTYVYAAFASNPFKNSLAR